MANKQYDSGTPVVRVLHPASGEVHVLPVPPDMTVGDLHASLSDAGYEHPGLSAALLKAQPTSEGTLENQESFKASVRDAILKAGYFHAPHEAAFTVTNQGQETPTQTGEMIFNEDNKARTELKEPAGAANTFGSVHTHPAVGVLGKNWGQGPSAQDVATAKQLKQRVMVVSSAGLFEVEPNGEITQTFKDDKWLNEKKKKK